MPKSSKNSPKIRSYRAMSEELAECLAWFESDNLDIDQAIAKYEQAIAIIAEMEKYLKTAKNKIKKITAVSP